jgi:hypothetical protein
MRFIFSLIDYYHPCTDAKAMSGVSGRFSEAQTEMNYLSQHRQSACRTNRWHAISAAQGFGKQKGRSVNA